MTTPRLTLFATLVTVATASPALALRADGALVLPQPPVEVLRGDSVTSAHVLRRADALEACAARTGKPSIQARVRMSWDRRGKPRNLRVTGGTAAFRRCAKQALIAKVPIVQRRWGSGYAVFVVRPPSSPDPLALTPAPEPAAAPDLLACEVDRDCTLHFRLHACVPSDPIAVNKSDLVSVYRTYPVRRLDCAMGGPQYTELRQANENRWTAACVRQKCTVR